MKTEMFLSYDVFSIKKVDTLEVSAKKAESVYMLNLSTLTVIESFVLFIHSLSFIFHDVNFEHRSIPQGRVARSVRLYILETSLFLFGTFV
jgi:hypothetical protein